MDIRAILVMILLGGGVFFFALGTLGLWRFPDVFCRAHASTKCDTLGCGLILLGLVLRMGLSWASLQLALIIGFIWITNATAAHLIGKAAYRNNYSMTPGTFKWNFQDKGE